MATQAHSLSFSSFTDALDRRAELERDKRAYVFLGDGEEVEGTLTFSELHQRAMRVARLLASFNARGQRAILLYPQGLSFVVAFFGCLYAGVIAVPASLPGRKRGIETLGRIATDSGASFLLSTETLLNELSDSLAAELATRSLTCIDPEQATVGPGAWGLSKVEPSALALLQYTSGSTGSPRGVAITHANLVDNHRAMQRTFAQDESTVIVSWLPMFHDMGLHTLLMAVWSGGECVLMSPGAFVQKPRRWLAAISRYRGTTSSAPDFAYDLCARRFGAADLAGLDLSSWRMAINGSEPVHASTIERFIETFAPCGFPPQAFRPAYGLAEATLLVTSSSASEADAVRRVSADGLARGVAEAGHADAKHVALVSCGRPSIQAKVVIVEPETRERRDAGQVGEIWVSSPSVAAGYWGRSEETEEVFCATTADGQGPFLRTGDLGFVDGGNLYVTGRLKDLIIIRGRNHYPQDIETSVSACHPALVPQGCAAFSVDSDHGEQLVVVQEVARNALRNLDAAAVVRAIRAVVSDEFALHTHAVVLLKPSTLPRTTSGKVRRKACREAFLEKTLPAIVSWVAPATPAPETDAHPDSARREASKRADRLIDWLRHHAADLMSTYASDGRWTVPPPLLRDFSKQGLLGMQVEPQYGGLGLGHCDAARVLEQLSSFDFALAMFVGLNNYLGIQPVARYAPAQTKALLLPGLAQGEELAAFAFQEPNGGQSTNAVQAQAEPEGEDHWRLFGTKYLDGVAQGAGIISVFAHHNEPPGVSAFVISPGQEGLRHLRDGLSMGFLGFTRDTIILEGVKVGRHNLLGSLGSGPDIAEEAMTHTRLAIGAACVGGMKRCAQVVGRNGPLYPAPVVGKLTPNPVTLSRLGSVSARVTAFECLVHRTARAMDAGHVMPAEAFAACRILGPDFLLRSIDDVMQLGVSGGYAETNRILCLYRDAGLLRHFDGPPEAVAERTGAVVMEGHASLRLLVKDVFCAPDVVPLIDPVLEVVRQRMANLSGPLARRAQRWGHTRAGELATWLVLLAAVEGSRRASPSGDIERAHAWARAQLEHALSLVRFGTPSETATIDTSEVAATFAAFATTTSDLSKEPSAQSVPGLGLLDPTRRGGEPTDPERSSGGPPSGGETSRRELRSWIISWLARRLQIPVAQVEGQRSFADHGLDSVASVELAKALSDRVGRELEETLLWNFSTIDALVEYLAPPKQPGVAPPASARESRSFARFEADAVLDEDIHRRAEPASSAPGPAKSVLLTGATGFLGAFLLNDLLGQTDARVHCLVRAADATAGAARVSDNLKRFGLWNEAFASRIEVVAGDVAQPRLGLSAARFAELADAVDAIFNNAALLSFVAAYGDLKPSHAGGTRELLRLASSGRPKALHHVSSVAVFDAAAYRNRAIAESTRPVESHGVRLPYAQCKWVTESLVWQAASRGIPVTVHRPSLIGGSSTSGASNTTDFLCRVIKAILEIGRIPGDLDLELDFSPVDYVSRAIVHLSGRASSLGRAFHLGNPAGVSLSTLHESLRSLGFDVRPIPYRDWVTLVESRPESPLYPLLPFLKHRWPPDDLTYMELAQRGYRARLQYGETVGPLREAGIECPPLDPTLIERYLQYLAGIGFIARAPSR